MESIFRIIFTLIIGFLFVTGFMINEMEHIPDNAKIYVIEEYKTWIPKADWVDDIFEEQSLSDANAKRSFDGKIESNYLEVKKGRFKDFQLPEEWRKNDGKSRIVWGKQQSLLMSWFFEKEERWNNDGSWNW